MRKLCSVLFALTLLPAAAMAATLGDAKIGFSADRLLVIDGKSYLGRIWTMPGRERHEQAIKAFRPVFLLRADSLLGEVVLPQLKTIVQFALPAELRLLGSPEAKKHPVGSDTVDGIQTTGYAFDQTVPEGRAAGTLWMSRDGIPMRLAGTFVGNSGKTSTVRWELSHVKIGPQPAALFEPPAGYSRLPAEAVAPLLGLKLKSSAH